MRTLLLAVLLFATAFAGCTTSNDGGSASVYVKDAPTDEFDEIHVVYSRVEVHRADGDAEGGDNGTGIETGNGTGDNSTAGWTTLFEDAAGVDIDLLNVSGDRAAFLGEADLAAGRYTQIRIHVLEAYGMQDDTRVDFVVSSGTLKVVRAFEVEADRESRIVLDFDLDRSLREQGNGQWRMTPVIGTTSVTIVEDAESGSDVSQTGDVEAIPA